MALQLGALRDALIEAGATPEGAAKASEELASYESDLHGIRADINLLRWMVGVNTALTLAVFVKLFIH
jgi:hypothetical protein